MNLANGHMCREVGGPGERYVQMGQVWERGDPLAVMYGRERGTWEEAMLARIQRWT